MNQISFFLEKFKTLQAPQAAIKQAATRVVEDMTGCTLGTEAFRVHKTTLYITAAAGLKAELFMGRDEFSARLEEALKAPHSIFSVR